jgi:hypothetical protein
MRPARLTGTQLLAKQIPDSNMQASAEPPSLVFSSKLVFIFICLFILYILLTVLLRIDD